jgi:hypothetical protein
MIALSVIVTVAPGPKSGPGGTSIPPPEANAPVTPVNLTANGLVRDTPPVIVTPDMETVGCAPSPSIPIVSTGPPPRITVVPLPDPTRVTLVVIVSPPVYTPGPILIVSPSRAATSAGPSWSYPQPCRQTSHPAACAGLTTPDKAISRPDTPTTAASRR